MGGRAAHDRGAHPWIGVIADRELGQGDTGLGAVRMGLGHPGSQAECQLQPHFGIRIIYHRSEADGHCGIRERFCQPQGVFPHGGRRIFQSGQDGAGVAGSDAIKGAEQVQPDQRVGMGQSGPHFSQHFFFFFLADIAEFPNQHHVSLVPLPFVGGVQRCCELWDRHGIEPGRLPGGFALRDHAVEPSLVLAQPVVGQQLGAAVFRQPVRVLNDVAVHVHHPERAVRAGARHDRAAPAVAAGEEIVFFLAGGAAEGVGYAVFHQNVMLHEVMERLAGEGVQFMLPARKEQIIPINQAAAGGGEMASVFKGMETFFRRADWIDRRIERSDDELGGVRRRDMGIPFQIGIRQHILPQGPAVLGAEPMSGVIAVAPELRGPALGPDVSGEGIEAEIAAAGFDVGLVAVTPQHRRGTMAAVVSSGGAIDTIVEPPAQPIGAQLLVAFGQAGDDLFRVVGPAITVGVFQIEQIRGGGHE